MRKWIYGFLGLFAIAVAIYYPYSPGGHQAINMRLAEDHIPVLLPKLQADPRFADVRLESDTENGGSLRVFGTLPDEVACADLRRIVLESFPLAPIVFSVHLPWPTTDSPTTKP
jgi:hypothetical protein